MRRLAAVLLLMAILLSACALEERNPSEPGEVAVIPYTVDTRISDVIQDPVFGDFEKLLFPVDEWYYSGDTLGELSLTWYTGIDPEKTVEILNDLQNRIRSGETVFYLIYTEEEKTADPAKEDTGLLFFKGEPGARFAVCSAGSRQCRSWESLPSSILTRDLDMASVLERGQPRRDGSWMRSLSGKHK